jgi:hypothetical protein
MSKWLTPERKSLLSRILADYLDIKLWQVDIMTGEYYCPAYEQRTRPLILDWQASDRADIRNVWEYERKLIHTLNERQYPLRGEFSAISRDIYAQAQPLYHMAGIGLSPLTLKPFALIRLSSTYVGLHVNLGDTLKRASKNQRRKHLRYGKRLPDNIQSEIDLLCRQAVNHWLEN